jgi:predicted component of type VI protein secretion system
LHVNTRSHKRKAATEAVIDIIGARVQRLEVLVAVMLARERRWPADTVADGCTELAAALATLPSGLLEMVADAVAALGCADV